MKQTIINETGINFLDFNSNKSNTLLFIHGNSHSHKTFSSQMQTQFFENYRLIFIDLPGHGKSGRLNTYSVKVMGEILSEFIKKLELINYLIIGHSLGGHVALNLLATQSIPQGLFIYGTPPLKNPFPPHAFSANPNAQALMESKPTPEVLQKYMGELNYSDEVLTNHIKDFNETDPNFRTTIFGPVISGDHHDEIELIHSYTGEVFFLLATNDSLINNNYIKEECLLNNRDYRVREIATGHSPHIEQANEFNFILLNFCEVAFKRVE